MDEFTLPHHHGEHHSAEALHAQLLIHGDFSAASDVFRQLADPTRVRIFWLLSHREECVINIAAMLEMSSPAVFHHLKTLTDSGLLVSRRDGREVYYKTADSELTRLLHELVEQVMQIACPEKTVDYQASQEELIRNVHHYLVEHLSERVTIDALARQFLMNPTTLKQVFKRTYGETIAAHMKRHRMEAAAGLLLQTQDDIAAVAQAVGYESQSRFSAAFREEYGVLPTEYRRQKGHGKSGPDTAG